MIVSRSSSKEENVPFTVVNAIDWLKSANEVGKSNYAGRMVYYSKVYKSTNKHFCMFSVFPDTSQMGLLLKLYAGVIVATYCTTNSDTVRYDTTENI